MVPDTVQPVRIASSVVGAVSNCASRGVVSSVRLEGPLSRGIYYRTPYSVGLIAIRSVDRRLPSLMCRVMVGIGLFMIGNCLEPV